MRRTILRRMLVVGAAVLAGMFVQALPAFGADTFTPNPVNVTLQAGASTTVHKTLHLDALPARADIVVAIDTTQSMCSAIAQAKAQATMLVNNINAAFGPGTVVRFALVDFKDYPTSPFGVPGDFPYLVREPLTPGAAPFQAAVNLLTCSGGNDGPEAYNVVFHNVANSVGLAFDPNAAHFLIVLGDSIPHDTIQATTFPACPNTAVADPIGHTATTIGELTSHHIPLLMISFGSFLSCYNQLTAATGGSAVASGGNLSNEIISQIQAAAAHIGTVNLVVAGQCPPVGLSFSPAPPYGPLTAPVDVVFNETITAPTVPGTYNCTVTALVDGTPRATQLIRVAVTPGNPAVLMLAPKTATNTVDATHCVTATVKDAFGNLTPGIHVVFTVTGAVSTTGNVVTNASGQAQFCYTGPPLPGADVISAFADTNNNGTKNTGEPSDTAAKLWVLPTSTPGCKVTNGGRITAADGDKATFGGNAKATGLQGEEEYQDHGPAKNMNVHSIHIQAVTCNAAKTKASIFGTATVNGGGTFNFRIDVADNGEPGRADTYRIRLSNGYDSGVQTLSAGGNVQIH
jgi:Bacterial Ig-like domain (group 1)